MYIKSNWVVNYSKPQRFVFVRFHDKARISQWSISELVLSFCRRSIKEDRTQGVLEDILDGSIER